MFVVVFVKWMYRFTALLFGLFKYSLYLWAFIINEFKQSMENIRKHLNEEGDFDLRIPVTTLMILEHGIDKASGIKQIHFSDGAIVTLEELDVIRELYFAGHLSKIKDQTIEGWVKFVRDLVAVRDSISDVDVTVCNSDDNKGYMTDSTGNKLIYRREDISWRPPTTCRCQNKEY